MGRIRTTLVKRNAQALVTKYGDEFSIDFDKNKEALAGLAEIPSKKLRNVVAGYITTLKNREEAKKKK